MKRARNQAINARINALDEASDEALEHSEEVSSGESSGQLICASDSQLTSNSAEDEAEEFFRGFKKTLPTILNKQLMLCGFTNSLSIGYSCENWIKQIENYIHSSLGRENNKEAISEICGPFCTDAKNYVMPPGHVSILNHLKMVICEKMGLRDSSRPSTNNNNQEYRLSHRSTSRAPVKAKLEPKALPSSIPSTTASTVANHYRKDLEKNVESYFKKIGYVQTLPEMNIFKSINTKGRETLAAGIRCIFCDKILNIFYDTSRTTGRWIISNYTNHMEQAHLKRKKTDNHDKSNKDMKNLQNKISHYFTRDFTSNSTSNLASEPASNSSRTKMSAEISAEIITKLVPGSSRTETKSIDSDAENSPLDMSEEEGSIFDNEQEQQLPNLSSSRPEPESKKYSSKYQKFTRSYRNKQKLVKVAKNINQLKITDFFTDICVNLTTIISENETFSEAFINFSRSSSNELNSKINKSLSNCNKNHEISSLLQKLSDISQTVKKTTNDRFDDFLKKFSTYIFLIGGRMSYEIIQANLPLPSLSTVSRYLKQSRARIVEGELRITELHEYLKERNYGTVIWLSEDGTRISDKVQYDNVTNTLVGLTLPLENGIPVLNYFNASDARTIENHITNYHTSTVAYTILAQPLQVKAPPFCVCIFGTDNKFTALDVIKRWQLIKDAAAAKGVTVLGVSGDGDTRILRAMEINSMIGQTSGQIVSHQIGDFFAMPLKNNTNMYYIQDTIHIGGKLRNKLLNEKSSLKIGGHDVSVDHLIQLTRTVKKDLHLIHEKDLDGTDKMNFDGVERISSEHVQLLLEEHIPNSKGTQIFLKCIRCVLDSFLKPDLEPLERLHKIWFVVFMFRIWRAWIIEARCSLSKNFITRNTYMCIELNAHALTLLLYNQDIEPRHFIPHLFSSQPCEKFFRTLRSMTSTQSTIVNFSMLEILYRIGRVSLQEELSNQLSEEGIKLPRFKKNVVSVIPEIKIPSKQEIVDTIAAAEHEALLIAFEFNLHGSSLDTSFQCTIASSENWEKEDENEKFQEELEVEETTEEEPPEYLEDMRKLEMTDSLNLKHFGHLSEGETLQEDSAFVAVKLKDKNPVIIRKTSLVWFLRKESKRVSTDRLLRFRH